MLALAVAGLAQAQEKVTLSNTQGEEIFVVVEHEPEFPGGLDKMYQFIASNVKYPTEAKEKGVSGTVMVSFVVERDGSISNPKVVKGIGAGCDEEVLRVLKAMPKWKPGRVQNKTVRVQYTLPFRFSLD